MDSGGYIYSDACAYTHVMITVKRETMNGVGNRRSLRGKGGLGVIQRECSYTKLSKEKTLYLIS